MARYVTLTAKDIIEKYKEFGKGNLFKLCPDKTNTPTTKKGSETYYIPYLIQYEPNKYANFKLRWVNQIISSNMTIPNSSKEKKPGDGEKTRYVQISFQELTKEDLAKSDYKEHQHNDLLAKNKEFIQALNIIADELDDLLSVKIKENNGSGKAGSYKLNKKENYDMSNIRQTHRKKREDDDGDEDRIPLDRPIYRFRVNVEDNNLIGKRYGKVEKGAKLNYIIHDGRKSTKADGFKPVIAKYNKEDINILNCGKFVTRNSLTHGEVMLNSITSSKYGVSAVSDVSFLNVWPHRKLERVQQTEEEGEILASFGTTGYVDEPDEDNADKSDESDGDEDALSKAKSKATNSKTDDDNKKKTKKKDIEENTQDDGDDEGDEKNEKENSNNKSEPKEEPKEIEVGKKKLKKKKQVEPEDDE